MNPERCLHLQSKSSSSCRFDKITGLWQYFMYLFIKKGVCPCILYFAAPPPPPIKYTRITHHFHFICERYTFNTSWIIYNMFNFSLKYFKLNYINIYIYIYNVHDKTDASLYTFYNFSLNFTPFVSDGGVTIPVAVSCNSAVCIIDNSRHIFPRAKGLKQQIEWKVSCQEKCQQNVWLSGLYAWSLCKHVL